MGRPLKDKRNYWSDDHRYLLAWAAQRTNRWLVRHDCAPMDPWDLMIEGWRRSLRYCRTTEELRQAAGQMFISMMNYARDEAFRSRETQWQQHDEIECDGEAEQIEARDTLVALLRACVNERNFTAAAQTTGLGLTLDEAGLRMGLCGERVRQLRKEFLAEARTKLKG